MTILSLPVEQSAPPAAKPQPAVRKEAEDELPPFWVLLLLPLALVLISLWVRLGKLTKAFKGRW